MATRTHTRRWVVPACLFVVPVLATLAGLAAEPAQAVAGTSWGAWGRCHFARCSCAAPVEGPSGVDGDGTWYLLRSPEQEKRVVIGLYNRYCIRCHGVDGRGVWDIPCVPDFTNARWQASRSDGQLVRAVLEGRGAVMPPFRGTLTLEEGWGMARYLRTFLPGTETPRPDLGPPGKGAAPPAGPEK